MSNDFYLRYYVGHKGKFGHEFLEFEFRPDGKLRYANNSNYKNDTMIRYFQNVAILSDTVWRTKKSTSYASRVGILNILLRLFSVKRSIIVNLIKTF